MTLLVIPNKMQVQVGKLNWRETCNRPRKLKKSLSFPTVSKCLVDNVSNRNGSVGKNEARSSIDENVLEKEEIMTECSIPSKLQSNHQIIFEHELQTIKTGIPPKEPQSQQCTDTEIWPYCAIGLVSVYDKVREAEVARGSGVLIARNIVLTAAHVVANKKHIDIHFIPGAGGWDTPFGVIDVISCYYLPNYKLNSNEDVAVLMLAEPIGNTVGYFGLHVGNQTNLEKMIRENKMFELWGYPIGNNISIGRNYYELWGFKQALSEIKNGMLIGSFQTNTGHSGSGIFYRTKNNECYIVGVHAGKGVKQSSTHTWITFDLFQHIRTWLKDTELNLSNEQRSLSSLNSFAKTKYENLRILNISDNFIALKELIALLRKQHSNKRRSDSMVDDDNGEAAIHRPNKIFENLLILDLSFNPISSKELGVLANYSFGPNLHSLCLSHCGFGDEGAQVLAENDSWTNLCILNLSYNSISDVGTSKLVQNSCWTKLKHFDISSNRLAEEGATELARHFHWTNLRTLDISHNKIGVEGAIAISKIQCWQELLTLRLSNNQIKDRGIASLARNVYCTNLQTLELASNEISDEGVMVLIKKTTWHELRNLDFSNNIIGDKGAESLSTNTTWSCLRKIDLSGNNITSSGLVSLMSGTKLKKLQLANNKIAEVEGGYDNLLLTSQNKNLSMLDLSSNQLDDDSLNKINSFNTLISVNIADNSIGDERAKIIGRNQSWINLENLNLSSNNLRIEGIESIAENSTWRHLFRLDLSNNKLCAKCALILGQNTSWTELQELNLSRNLFGDEGAAAISQNISWKTLRNLDLSENNIYLLGALALLKNKYWGNLEELSLQRSYINSKNEKSRLQHKNFRINLKNITFKRVRGERSKSEKIDLTKHELALNVRYTWEQDGHWNNSNAFEFQKLILSSNKYSHIQQQFTLDDSEFMSPYRNSEDPTLLFARPPTFVPLLTNIDTRDAEFLFPNIEFIDLSYNYIGDKGVATLVEIAALQKISSLNLKSNLITAEGASKIAAKKDWINLECLNISWNPIKFTGGLLIFKNVECWYKLKILYLIEIGLDPAEKQSFLDKVELRTCHASRSRWPNKIIWIWRSTIRQVIRNIPIMSCQFNAEGLFDTQEEFSSEVSIYEYNPQPVDVFV